MSRIKLQDPSSAFQVAVEAIAREDFELVADCVDKYSLRAFRDEVHESERFRLFREGAVSRPDYDQWASEPDRAPIDPRDADARAVFVGWLNWVCPRAQIQRQLERGEVPQELAAAFLSVKPSSSPLRIVGVVEEDSRFAHILYRARQSEPDEEWLRQFPDDERSARRDAWLYTVVSRVQARRQRDGTWRLIAARPFLHVDDYIQLSHLTAGDE